MAYAFQVTGSVQGVELVAYPMNTGSGTARFLRLELDKEWRPVQGFVPGIYSLPAADAADLALFDGKDDDALGRVLASKGHVCAKAVPRVFQVSVDTKIEAMVDVFRVDATPSGCRAALVKTLYSNAQGAHGEGSVDASGRRVPPEPFGDDLPEVGDLGFPLGPPWNAPARGGCAACAVSSARSGYAGIGWWLALALGIARRATRLGSSRRAVHRLLVLVAMLAVAGWLVACGQKLNVQKAETIIRDDLATRFATQGLVVNAVTCPKEVRMKQGSSFACEAHFQGGGTLAVAVAQTDDKGTIEWTMNQRIIVVDKIEQQIIEQARTEGHELAVNCGDRVRVVVAQSKFQCMGKDAEGKLLVYDVVMQNDSGDVHWTQVTQQATPP